MGARGLSGEGEPGNGDPTPDDCGEISGRFRLLPSAAFAAEVGLATASLGSGVSAFIAAEVARGRRHLRCVVLRALGGLKLSEGKKEGGGVHG